MATYFPDSGNQRDDSSMLYGYSEPCSSPSPSPSVLPINNFMMMMHMGSQNHRVEGIRDQDLLFMNHPTGNGIQGLSLSLSTQMHHHQPSNMNYANLSLSSSSFLAGNHSNYLEAAQQLLDEAVNLREALKQQVNTRKIDEIKDRDSRNELSPSEKHELKNKLAKLLPMLDEVDRKYKHYYNQMQIVASSFDAIAGTGATVPYTALAVQTISRHFRCLRDSIATQIKITKKSLGEQDGLDINGGNSKGIGISRLRFVDQQLRQQKALQQMGLMQPHSWRPERGLPEHSVSLLRAWLFEHFLHPYPKDSDKSMLARQTGLTRNQVSNWFINARVRLWKPMVEEMYKEEFVGEAEMESSSASEELHRTDNFQDVEEMVGLHVPAQSEEVVGVGFGPMMGSSSSSSSSNPYQITEMGKYGKTLSLGLQQGHDHGYVDFTSHYYNQNNIDDSSMVAETTDQLDCLDSSSNRQQRFGYMIMSREI